MPYVYPDLTVKAARLLELAAAAVLAAVPPAGARRSAPRTIVLLEPFQMGDVISLAVMLDPLKARFSNARIVLWCHSKNQHLLQGDARVAHIVHAPFPWSSHAGKRGRLRDWLAVLRSVGEVRALRPDVGIDCRGEIRSQILLRAAGCGRRIGFVNYFFSNMVIRGLLLTDNLGKGEPCHRYELNLRLLQPLLGHVPRLKLPSLAMPLIAPRRIAGPGERQIVFQIGAGWRHRRWRAERWASLMDALGRHRDLHLVLVNGPGEEPLVREVLARTHVPVERVTTSFDELVAVIKAADLFICLDSGPMHIALALGVRTLALFGPGNTAIWHPLGEGDRFVAHGDAFPCHPCLQKACVVPHADCMSRIEAAEAIAAAFASLGLDAPPEGRRAAAPAANAAPPALRSTRSRTRNNTR
jgi:ADP-heptose:LPS heptosyltransferase